MQPISNKTGTNTEIKQPPPVATLRALFRRPCFVVGTPVTFPIFLFALATPVKRFILNPYVLRAILTSKL